LFSRIDQCIRAKTSARGAERAAQPSPARRKGRSSSSQCCFAPMTMTHSHAIRRLVVPGDYKARTTHDEGKAIALGRSASSCAAAARSMISPASTRQRIPEPADVPATAFSRPPIPHCQVGPSGTDCRTPKSVMRLGGEYLCCTRATALMAKQTSSAAVKGQDDPKELAKQAARTDRHLITLSSASQFTGAVQTLPRVPVNTATRDPSGSVCACSRDPTSQAQLAPGVKTRCRSSPRRGSTLRGDSAASAPTPDQPHHRTASHVPLWEGKYLGPAGPSTGAPPKSRKP